MKDNTQTCKCKAEYAMQALESLSYCKPIFYNTIHPICDMIVFGIAKCENQTDIVIRLVNVIEKYPLEVSIEIAAFFIADYTCKYDTFKLFSNLLKDSLSPNCIEIAKRYSKFLPPFPT